MQAKLVVGEAGDRHEREADAVAERVARLMATATANGSTGRVRATSGAAVSGKRVEPSPAMRVQRMTGGGGPGGRADEATERQVRGAIGGGRPLPAVMRSRAESAFGADFGHIRVHDDARATELSTRIQAKAFTTGNDIFFRDGIPDPASESGRRLLAHELTHTIQQAGAARPTLQRYLDPVQAKELASARQQLQTLLQSPKGKGKAAKNRKSKIDDLRLTVQGLEATGASTAEPTPVAVAPRAADPAKQEEVDRKFERLQELEGQDPSGLDEKQTKDRERNIARLNRGIVALSAAAPKESVPAPSEKAEAAGSGSKSAAVEPPAGGEPETAETEAPKPAGPDLAVTSLRTTAAELAELKGKDVPPSGKSRQRHNKKIRDLEAKVAGLETAIDVAYPELSKAVGNANAQELTNTFGENGVSALRATIADGPLKTLCDKVGAVAMKGFVDVYGVATFWDRMQAWRPAGVEKLLTKFTPAQIRDLDLAIGPARFRLLLVAKGLSAAAFEHYSADFLRTFAGATNATWQHLVTIKYSNFSGAISGGHDRDVFYAFVDAENEDQERISIDSAWSVGPYEKVTYTTYHDDGAVAQTGSKTLIPGLAGMKAAMLADVNAALWHAISNCTFDPGRNDWWAATPNGATSFSGFFRNGQIDTFFPN